MYIFHNIPNNFTNSLVAIPPSIAKPNGPNAPNSNAVPAPPATSANSSAIKINI